ncbi:hypothetical protein Tco_0332149 [Tanacetum coccineum]
MSSVSSAVTYTSVYTDSEPGRVFWGADEEISDGGIPRVIVLGYDGLPMQPNEHELPAEEPPLPPVNSPTVESPGYVTESDPEEDPEEYEDDETKDGPADYPMDGGDDGDDDDGDSSRDDTDYEEEEEHLAPADSTVVVPTDEPVASISLPPEEEVERLLAMTTLSPSPPISLSHTLAGERLARCMAPPAQIITTTFTCPSLPSPPLPPLPPSLYIPPPVDRRDDFPKSELPPRKRLCSSTLGSRYETGESSTARPTRDRGTLAGGCSELATYDPPPRTPVGEVIYWGHSAAELHEHDTQDLYALLEDAQDSRSRIITDECMDSQREIGEMQTKLLALRGQRRARQPAPDARIPNHQDASGDADSHV